MEREVPHRAKKPLAIPNRDTLRSLMGDIAFSGQSLTENPTLWSGCEYKGVPEFDVVMTKFRDKYFLLFQRLGPSETFAEAALHLNRVASITYINQGQIELITTTKSATGFEIFKEKEFLKIGDEKITIAPLISEMIRGKAIDDDAYFTSIVTKETMEDLVPDAAQWENMPEEKKLRMLEKFYIYYSQYAY